MAAFAIAVFLASVASARTTDCNYVVDLFESVVNPPSLAPTAAPTRSPTATPTRSPTNTGETTILPTNDEADVQTNGDASSSSAGNVLFMKPYSLDYCYSVLSGSEPFNSYSFKYECVDSNVKRTMYWDNLDCTGSDTEELIIYKQQQGTNIVFQCEAAANCDAAKVTIQEAITMSPTPAPTPQPTPAPTNAPTNTGEVLPTNTVMESDTIDVAVNGDSGSSGAWYAECDNISGPNADSDVMMDGIYAVDVCISVFDLSILEVDTNDFAADTSFGWYCNANTNQYVFGIFRDTECTMLMTEDDSGGVLIAYTEDSCLPLEDSALWTSVTCGYYDGGSGTISSTSSTTSSSNTDTIIEETDVRPGDSGLSVFHSLYIVIAYVFVLLAVFE